jgi:hypothetical protein
VTREQSLTLSVLQKSLVFFSAWRRKVHGPYLASTGRTQDLSENLRE